MLPGELSVAEAIAALAAAERDWAVVGSSGQGVITHRELLRAQPDDRLQDVVAVGMPLTLADLAQPEALSTKVGDRDYVLVVGAQGECLGVWERHRWQLLQQGYELWHNQTIASLMNPQVVTMPPEWSLAQARDFLAQEGATWAMVASPATPRLALGWVSWQALWQPGATVQEVMQPPRFLPATLPLSQAIRHWQEWVQRGWWSAASHPGIGNGMAIPSPAGNGWLICSTPYSNRQANCKALRPICAGIRSDLRLCCAIAAMWCYS
jgi:hypothetical protein